MFPNLNENKLMLITAELPNGNSCVVRNSTIQHMITEGPNGSSTDFLGSKYENFTQEKDALTLEAVKNMDEFRWKVKKFGLRDEFNGGGEDRRIKGRKALVREDNGFLLAVVNDDYWPLQNEEALSMIAPYENELGQMYAAGTLDGGRTIFALMKMKMDPIQPVEGDEVAGYHMLEFRHGDPKEILTIRPITVRLICDNGMVSFDTNADRIVVPFRTPVSEVLDLIYEKAENTATKLKTVEERLKLLAQAEVKTGDDLENYFLRANNKTWPDPRRMAAIEAIEDEEDRAFAQKDFEDKLKRARRSIKKIEMAYQHEADQMPAIADTWYCAYNAMTRFTTHIQGSSTAGRFQSNWFGHGMRVRDRSFNLACQYAKVEEVA